MAIDDLIPEEDRNTSGRSSSSTSEPDYDNPFSDPDLKSFGSPPHDKHFTEEKWEEVKTIIREEFGMIVNEVLNNKTTEEQYNILHEAATYTPDEDEEPEYVADEYCVVCGSAVVDETTVELEDEDVCVHHTAAQVRSSIDSDNE